MVYYSEFYDLIAVRINQNLMQVAEGLVYIGYMESRWTLIDMEIL